MFYGSLTGWADPRAMRDWLVSYLRFVGFSAVALAVAACAKLAPAETAMGRPEPRFGEPPKTSQIEANPAARPSEEERISDLEAQVAALDVELTHLRKALDVLGPLPDQPDLFIPVAQTEITGAPADPADAELARLARLYAPAPMLNRASTLFYEAELGSFANKTAAEARWRQLVAANRLAGLAPAYADVGSEIRLSAGPLASEAAVDALCVELSALAGACRVVTPIRAY
jgi:cell division septation protein DedD